jgi:integrase
MLTDMYPYADVAEVTPAMCRRFVDRWQNHNPRTLASIVSILATFFDWLDEEGYLEGGRSPMERIRRPRLPLEEEDDSVVTVSASDVQKLFAATSDWTDLLTIAVLAYLGPRRQAAAAARVRDYDPVGRMLVFREKGAKTIEKPCPDRLAAIIDGALSSGVYASPDDYLIPPRAAQRRSGDRDGRALWKVVRKIADRAGVDAHVHSLRGAFATHYLETHPGDLEALQSLMGHRQLSTTQKYLRRLNRRQAMERVRDLSWDTPAVDTAANARFPQRAGIEFESLRLTEKEGFEPSFDDIRLLERQGLERAASAPLDQALFERIRDAVAAAAAPTEPSH